MISIWYAVTEYRIWLKPRVSVWVEESIMKEILIELLQHESNSKRSTWNRSRSSKLLNLLQSYLLSVIFPLAFFMKEIRVGSLSSLCWIKQMFSTLPDVKFPALGPSCQNRMNSHLHSSSPFSNECSFFATYPNKPEIYLRKERTDSYLTVDNEMLCGVIYFSFSLIDFWFDLALHEK